MTRFSHHFISLLTLNLHGGCQRLFTVWGKRVVLWTRSREESDEGETLWGRYSPQQTPYWREEKHESSCFAKRSVVASNPFRNTCYSSSPVTEILLISCFFFDVWQLGSAEEQLIWFLQAGYRPGSHAALWHLEHFSAYWIPSSFFFFLLLVSLNCVSFFCFYCQ